MRVSNTFITSRKRQILVRILMISLSDKLKSLKVTNNTGKLGEQFQSLGFLVEDKHDG